MGIYLPIKRGFAFWPFLFMPERVKGTSDEGSYLAHEKAHYERQAWWTPIWIALYFVSKKFRWQEVKIAYKAEILYRIGKGETINKTHYIDEIYRNYWGMCTRRQARDFIDKILKGNP